MSKKKTAPVEIDHVVTEQTIALNPDLAEQGVQVGETISYPAEPEEAKTFECALCEREKSLDCRTIGRPNVCQSCTIEELTNQSAIKDQEIASLNEQLTQQDQETEDLRIQLKEVEEIAQDALSQFNNSASKAPQPFEATSASGKQVKVNFGVHHNGKQYSAADLVEDPDAIEELITIGSGSITLIEE